MTPKQKVDKLLLIKESPEMARITLKENVQLTGNVINAALEGAVIMVVSIFGEEGLSAGPGRREIPLSQITEIFSAN